MPYKESDRRPHRDDHTMAIFSAIAGTAKETPEPPPGPSFGRQVVTRWWRKACDTSFPVPFRAGLQPVVSRAAKCLAEARDRLNA